MGAMIAYVFWHWPQAGVATDEYESRQRAFQAALERDPPPGFRGGRTWRITDAPWANDGGAAYEDWYLLEGLGDLEALNQAAVSGSRLEPHNAVARLAAGGTAGVYALQAGRESPEIQRAVWLSKPAGVSYPAFLLSMSAPADGGTQALWMRQMVLGPTPEFCLRLARNVIESEDGVVVPLRPVWPGPHGVTA